MHGSKDDFSSTDKHNLVKRSFCAIYAAYLLSAAFLISLRSVDVLRFKSKLIRSVCGTILLYLSATIILCSLSLVLGVFLHREDLQGLSKIDKIPDVKMREGFKKNVSSCHVYGLVANVLSSFSILCVLASFSVIVLQTATFPNSIISNRPLEVCILAALVLGAVALMIVSEFLYMKGEEKLSDVLIELAENDISIEV